MYKINLTNKTQNAFKWEDIPEFREFISNKIKNVNRNNAEILYGIEEVEAFLKEYPDYIFKDPVYFELEKIYFNQILISFENLLNSMKPNKLPKEYFRENSVVFYEEDDILSSYSIEQIVFNAFYWSSEDKYSKTVTCKNLEDKCYLLLDDKTYLTIDPHKLYIPLSSLKGKFTDDSNRPKSSDIMERIYIYGGYTNGVILEKFFQYYRIYSHDNLDIIRFISCYLFKNLFKENPYDLFLKCETE